MVGLVLSITFGVDEQAGTGEKMNIFSDIITIDKPLLKACQLDA